MAFCVFEFCVGLFWPSMMKMRAAHVPEEMRATIINFFRIPLNLFVCIVLYHVSLRTCVKPKRCNSACMHTIYPSACSMHAFHSVCEWAFVAVRQCQRLRGK